MDEQELLSGEPAVLVATLEAEIRKQQNAEEVGFRLSDTRKEVCGKAFSVLLDLAERFAEEPTVMDALISGGKQHWPITPSITAVRLKTKGMVDRSRELFDRWIGASPDFSTMSLNNLVKLFGNMSELERPVDERQRIFTEVRGRICEGMGKLETSEVVSIAHLCARSGDLARAKELCDVLLQHNVLGLRKYVEFVKEYEPDARVTLSTLDLNFPADGVDAMLEYARGVIHTTDRWYVEDLCRQALASDCSQPVTNKCINLARDASTLNDQELCVALWELILDANPDLAGAFLDFSREHIKIMNGKKDTRTGSLIRRAHMLCTNAPKKEKKQPLKLRTSVTHVGSLAIRVSIGDRERTAHEWLSIAGQHANAGESEQAFALWMPVLVVAPGVKASVIRGMIHLLHAVPPNEAIAHLRVPEVLKEYRVDQLYLSLAANLRESEPDLAHEVLCALNVANRTDPSNVKALSRSFLRRKQLPESVNAWLPLLKSHADECATFALDLLEYGYARGAHLLLKRIMEVSPETALDRFPEQILHAPVLEVPILDALEGLLPKVGEGSLGDRELYLLKILMRHRSGEKLRRYIEKLYAAGALTNQDIRNIMTVAMRK